jgi:hypothetical protein
LNWLFESSSEQYVLLIALAASAVALSVIWLKTGKRALLIASIADGGLVVLILLAGHWIVTPREEVEATLQTIAADVESNDLNAVLAHIHSSRDDIRRRAEAEMPRYRFTEVRINSIEKVTSDTSADPPTAEAEFYVGASGDFGGDIGAVYGDRPVTRFVILKFEKEDGAWKVIDYEHHAPFARSGGGVER